MAFSVSKCVSPVRDIPLTVDLIRVLIRAGIRGGPDRAPLTSHHACNATSTGHADDLLAAEVSALQAKTAPPLEHPVELSLVV